MECILQELESSEEEIILKRVDFSNIRLCGLRAETLKSLTRLEEFTANSEAKLTGHQLRTIFTEIVEGREEINLKVLKIPGNPLVTDTWSLSSGLVAAAVERLVTIDVEATHISDLAEEIFKKETVFFNSNLFL